MDVSFTTLRRRKIFQWGIAYLAGAWLLLQVATLVGGQFDWPRDVLRGLTVLLALGFPIALVIAWYHGEQGRQRVSGPEVLMVAALLVVAGAALALVRRGDDATAPAAAAGEQEAGEDAGAPVPASIAVLPFANLSGDPAQEFFSDGMTEEVIAHLAKVDGLTVISRTSVMGYKGAEVGLREIGRELGVATILEGSVRRDGERVRVTAQLVDAASDAHLWAETYDREMAGIFEIQGDIATSIARALEVELSDALEARLERIPTTSESAYRAYLRGRYFWNRRTAENLRRAMELFQEAVAEDPDFALAHVAIAETHMLLIPYAGAPPDEAWRSVEAAARRALEIDPHSGEAWLVLATLEQGTADDVQEATAMFERAVELAPGYATGRQWYAEHLIIIGRIDEAVRQAERAHTLDPQSPVITAILGMAYYYDRRYEEAIRHGRAAREMNPAILSPHVVLIYAYGKTGRYPEAIEAVAGLNTILVGPERAVELEAGLRRAWEADGASGYWRQFSADMEEFDTPPAIAAVPRLRLGDREGALDRIERAVEEGSVRWVESSLYNPEFDELRDDPRFRRLLERLRGG